MTDPLLAGLPDQTDALLTGLPDKLPPLGSKAPAAEQFKPDVYAGALKTSKELGIPPDVVARNPQEIAQLEMQRRLDSVTDPDLKAWLADGDNISLASDDIDSLKNVSMLVRAEDIASSPMRGVYGGIGRGVSGLGNLLDSGAYGLSRLVGGKEDAEQYMVEARQSAVNPASWLRSVGGWIEGGAIPGMLTRALGGSDIYAPLPAERQNLAADIGEGFGNLVGNIVSTMANPASAVALMAGQGADAQAERATAAGATEGEKAAATAVGATITAVTEKIGLDALLNRLPPQVKGRAAQWVADKIVGAGIEGGQEAIEQVANNVTAQLIYDPESPLLEGVGDSATVGAAVGALARTVFGIKGRYGQAEEVKGQQTQIDALVKATASSKLAQRTPERFQELVQRMAANGAENVYVPAEAVQTLYQSEEPARVAFDLGVPVETYLEAILTGGDIAIPVGSYLTKVAPQHHDALREVARFTPGAMTPEETAQMDEQAQAAADQFMASVQSTQPSDAKVYDDVTGMLLGTGRYRREDVEKYAQLVQAGFRTLGAREGIDPFQLYQQYRLRIKAELPAALQRTDIDTVIDPLIERLRTNDRPKDTRQTLADFIADTGGVTDSKLAGELASLSESDRVTRKGKKRLVREDAGRDLDRAREAAAEAGYLPEDSDVNDLLALLDQEMSGRPVYAQGDEGGIEVDTIRALDSLEEELGRRGIDVTTASNADIKAALFGTGDVASVPDELVQVFDQGPVRDVELTAKTKGGEFRLRDTDAPAGTDFSEFGQVRRVQAFDGDKVVGTLVYANDGTPPTVEVDPEYRRKGVGTAMLKLARQQGGVLGDATGGIRGRAGEYRTEAGQAFRSGADESVVELNQSDRNAEAIKRGYIKFGGDRAFTIGLLKDADATTFLHETGHFFLEVMGDLATDPNASPGIIADYQAALDWLGVADRSEIKTEHHEKWARGFEAYLGEGKAPSPELASAFFRFKAWVKAIYRTLTALNVELSDDVRGVFDRLLATDEEITQAEQSMDYAPLFADARSAGWSDAEFATRLQLQEQAREEAETRLMTRAMRDVTRETKAWWKERSDDVRAEVTAEVQAQPVYRAWSYLKNGTNPDGSPLPPEMEVGKLDKDWLLERYGQEWLNKNLLRKRVYAVDGGLSPEVVAAINGFDSADDMVRALANAQPMNAVIEAETHRRMVDQYGDILTDGTMPEAAMRAVHGNRRFKAMEADLRALERLAGEPRMTPGAARRAAELIVGQKRVRDVQPHVYLRAERKAAKEAIQASGRQEWGVALEAQRRRMLNANLYSEAIKARDSLERTEKLIAKTVKTPAQKRLAAAGGKWRDLTNSILAAVGARPIGEGKQRLNVAGWVNEHISDGSENPIPLSVETLTDSGATTALRDLTVQDMRGVAEAIRNINKQVASANTLLRDGKRVNKEATIAELRAQVESTFQSLGSAFSDAEKSGTEIIGEAYRGFADVLLNPQTIVERMDGGESGPWHDLFWNMATDSREARSEMREKTLRPLVDLLDGLSKEQRARLLTDDVKIESLGVTLKRQTLVSMALNMGTDSSLEKLKRGGRWVNGRHVTFDDRTIREVVASLSREDWNIVEAVWGATAAMWEPSVDLQTRLGGIVPEKLRERTIETPFGKIQGRYFPLVADRSQSVVGRKQAATDTIKEMTSSAVRATTSKARLQERTGAMYPLELNLETLLVRRVDEVITDVTHREWLIQANQILDDSELSSVLRNRVGETAYLSLKAMVARSVNDRNYGDPSMAWPNKLMDNAILNLSSMALGFRFLLGGANYVTAWAQAASRVSPKFLVSAFGRTAGFRNFKASEEFVHGLSPYMARRNGDFDRTLTQALERMSGRQSLRKKVIRMGLAYQAYADRLAVVPIWMARFEQARAENVPTDQAVRLADKAIQQTQTDNSAIGQSAFEGEKSWRLFKMFIGPMIIQGNRIRDAVGSVDFNAAKRLDFKNVIRGGGASRDMSYPERMGVLLAAWVVPALIFDLAMGRWPDDDDEEERDAGDWVKWSAVKVAMYPMMTVPFVRDAAAVLEAKLLDKPVFARNNPVSDAGAVLAKAAADTTGETVDAFTGEDVDGEKLVKGWAKAIGATTGAPTTAIMPPSEFIYDVGTGEYSPQGPQDLRYLFMRREEKK